MAGGIDTSNRKPRRMRGTPAIKFSNRLAAVVLGFGILTGLILKYARRLNFPQPHPRSQLTQISVLLSFSYVPLVDDINKKFNFNVLEVSVEEQERRQLFNFIKQKRGEAILKILEEKEGFEKDM